MRIIPIAGFLLLLNWQASAQAPQATDSAKPSNSAKCIVEGSIARQDTGAALKKAAVVLRSNETFEKSAFTITDDQGHFEFDNVEPGSYRLDAAHDGYLDSQYGQKKPGDPGTNLSLAAGQRMTDLVFKLPRPASITGHVIDADGEPLSNVSVKAYQASNRRGKRPLGTVAEAIARAAYGVNYDRLVTLKNKYDPTNFFRLNHNIKPNPAAQAASGA
jgi:hypothetical protein